MTAEPASPESAIWLLPAEEDRLALQAEIDRLAARLGSPTFVPHVTVAVNAGRPLAELDAALATLAQSHSPCALEVAGVGHGPSFFQCLFLTFVDPSPVTALRLEVARALGPPGREPATPHLSLAYAHLGEPERLALAQQIRPPARLRFDSLVWVAPREGQIGWDDVAGWRVRGEVPLLESSP
ncbi:MAG TPA: 2'-5' RNA ligase family protein [Thermoanaerobaculia bacterium]|nr:2'-5' RNA ligase family protein [Thermoanaerobaculia bacterium]